MKIFDLLNYTGYLLQEVEKNLNLTTKVQYITKDKCKKILEYG